MRKKIVWAGVIIMIAMCFFPPWERTYAGLSLDDPRYVCPDGHHCIFLPQGGNMTIDVTRLRGCFITGVSYMTGNPLAEADERGGQFVERLQQLATFLVAEAEATK
ncbi:MAG TPA: hypothetical protein VNA25_21030, partial [Phycisphaerae bacterium]|nr:hypothetical protein [Phycisphaerae bacterium]